MIDFLEGFGLETLDISELRCLDQAIMTLFEAVRSKIALVHLQQWIFLDNELDQIEVRDLDDEKKSPVFFQAVQQKVKLLSEYYSDAFSLNDLLRTGRKIMRRNLATYLRHLDPESDDHVSIVARHSRGGYFNIIFPGSYLEDWHSEIQH